MGGHFVRCPALYVRMCHARVSVLDTLRWHMTARLVDAWDVSATLQCPSGVTLTVRKMSLNYALGLLMYSCRFCS